VLFVCENNLYACYTRISTRQPDRPIHGLAAAHGCTVLTADGNNVQTVFDAAQLAVNGLREGRPPVFLECSTYRWREHCGPNSDDDLGYRPPGEPEAFRSACPINRLAAILDETSDGAEFMKNAEREIAVEINEAFAAALAGTSPQPAELPGYLYA
jgi:pyruvate dehydrogenase E1 component alpha subunit